MTDTRRTLTTSDGVELVYWVTPETQSAAGAIVLVHGAASNHTRWSEFVEETSLRSSWRLMVPDMRGNGESMARGRLRIPIWCRDLSEIISAEGYERVLVFGHSLGAQIAVSLATTLPSTVCGLVLLDPVFRRALTGRSKRLGQYRWLGWPIVAALRFLNACGLRRGTFPSRDLRKLDQETRAALGGDQPHEVIAKKYRALGPILRHMPTANYLQQVLETVGPLPPAERIEVPVLVLLSTGVTFADPGINREEIARFPRAEVATIEANHWPLTEKPDEVRNTVETWVQQHWRSQGSASFS